MFLLPRAMRSLALTLLLPLFLLGGCATTNPRDPLEPVNRVVYQFNEGVDTAIFRPLAEGYRFIVPQFLRNSIANFFSNINDILVCLNNLLQGKLTDALSDFGRVVMNSTLGFAGLFDIATEVGMEKHNEDFGQTLGRWGVGGGPYLVLPLLGPSTLRDAVGRFVDAKADPLGYLNDIRWRNSLYGTRFISDRTNLLDTTKILETAALDPYEFVRDAYLQRRRNLIFDGSPPREKDDDAQAAPARQGQTPAPSVEGEPPAASVNASPAAESGAPQVPVAPAAPAEREAAPAEAALPSEPTGAGAAATLPVTAAVAAPRVARVWLAPLGVDSAPNADR